MHSTEWVSDRLLFRGYLEMCTSHATTCALYYSLIVNSRSVGTLTLGSLVVYFNKESESFGFKL